MGISIISPPKIVVTGTIFLYLVFLVTYGNHILDYFYLFKVMFISFIFKLINFFKTKNVKELEHMEYICDKIILVTKHEKLHIYFKTKIMG
jgi:hypothetical protein